LWPDHSITDQLAAHVDTVKAAVMFAIEWTIARLLQFQQRRKEVVR